MLTSNMPKQLSGLRRMELMNLPNELLYEIVKNLIAQQPKYPAVGGIKYSPIYNLSLSNKRLRDIARPFVWRYLYYHSISNKEPLGFGVHHLQKPQHTPLSHIFNRAVNRIWEVREHDKDVKYVQYIRTSILTSLLMF